MQYLDGPTGPVAPYITPRTKDTPMMTFEPDSRARSTDPETSHDAAASIDHLRDRQMSVLTVLWDWGPMTDTDLVERYEGLAREELIPRQAPSGIRTRRKELVDLGLVSNSGARQKLASGRWAIVWRAVAP
jgi:hypothetical protein